jgi:DNA polymerase-4
MAVLRRLDGVTVEVMGWDEAFVGATVADDASAEALARRIQAAVTAETRLTCAVGIGDNLLRAKIATEFGKPGGGSRSPRRTGSR